MARDLRGQSTRFDIVLSMFSLLLEFNPTKEMPYADSTSSFYFVEAFSFWTSHFRLPVLAMRAGNPVILSDGRILISPYSIPPNLRR